VANLTILKLKRINTVLKQTCGLLVLLLPMGVSAPAQTTTSTSTTNGKTPAGLAPGAPTGSYALSGFDNINPFNQSLNFRLPLLRIGGRGSAGYTMTLPIERKWHIEHNMTDFSVPCPPERICETPDIEHTYIASDYLWNGLEPGYGPGVLQGRRAGSRDTQSCGGNHGTKIYERTLTRLTFTASDGTEFELRDQLTGGKPLPGQCTGSAPRGTVFVTADGTFATFISDSVIVDYSLVSDHQPFPVSGYLLMRDGARYRIHNGIVSWIRDRHGNLVQFGPEGITDSLGRVVTISYATTTRRYDEIIYHGFGGATRTIRVWYDTLYHRLRPAHNEYVAESPETYQSLFPTIYPLSTEPLPLQDYNPQVVASVELPDEQRHYSFYYNSYGELARVELPTGGAFEYDYYPGEGLIPVGGDLQSGPQYEVSRSVTARRVYGAGGVLESWMDFGGCTASSSPPSPTDSCVEVDQRDPKQINSNNEYALVERSRHYYHGNSAPKPEWFEPVFYNVWNEGKEYKTEAVSSDGTSILRRTEQMWRQRATPSWWTSANLALYGPEPSYDPRMVETTATLPDVVPNLVTKQTAVNPSPPHEVMLDEFNNQTDVWEYAYGYGGPGPLLRHTHVNYLTTNQINGLNYTGRSTPDAPSLLGLQAWKKVYGVDPSNGAEILLAHSETLYDEPGSALPPYGSITGWADPGTAARGHATTNRRWLNTDGSFIETHAQFDQAGNVVKSWDGRGQLWQTSYVDSYADGVSRNTYAYPTQMISPIPDIGWNLCSTTSLVTSTVYDYSTGLVKTTTDANGRNTAIAYHDSFDRPTRVDFPDGGYTTYAYGRNIYGDYVRSQTLQNSSTQLLSDSYNYSDGLGRPSRSFQYENSDPANPWLTNDTQYDAMGRVRRVSNTYRSAGGATAINPLELWATSNYDALGRVISVATPDGALVTTSYSGNGVTVTAPAGKKRSTYTDALGRLAAVVEDPSGPTPYLTEYTYDALDNLRVVKQGDQRRYFKYDSLSRLIRTRNPEQGVNPDLNSVDIYTAPGEATSNSQWSMAYIYDANSNLLSRTEARGVTANYTYDNLNRNIRVAYPDTGSAFTNHHFDGDGVPNGRGRMHYSVGYVNNSLPETANVIDGYDAMGRPLSQRQRFWTGGAWSAPYTVERTYDQAGHILTQTYPSGRGVSYSYDVAGRTAAFAGNLGDDIARTYASAVAFDNTGRMTREQLGTDIPLYNKRHYNVRGQLYDVRLSSVNDEFNWNRGAVVNYYSLSNFGFGSSGADNNGNLLVQQHFIPHDDAIIGSSYYQQNYDYDALNRLSWVSLYSGNVNTGFQKYSYDRYGNRTISDDSWGAGINELPFIVDTATNRLGVPGGVAGAMQYDANGNLTNDSYTGAGTRTYDAENRIVSAADSSGGQSTYAYNGEGQRVKRQTGGQTTWQVYGMDAELVAEYAANAAPSAPQKEYGYRNAELLITATAPAGTTTRTNVALATNGGAAIASPTTVNNPTLYPGYNFSPSVAIDGDRKSGVNFWRDDTPEFADWLQVNFSAVRNISEIDVFTLQDNDQNPSEPTEAMTFSLYGITDFNVEYLNGSTWTAVPGGQVTGNNKVWKKFTFPSVTASSIRVYVTGGLAGRSRIAEVEAYEGGTSGAEIEWLVTDQLGTPRMVADRSGSLSGIRRHDYLPFGEELYAGSGGRTTGQGYTADAVRQKFTGKERDSETGLDYSIARYYSSLQGRFTTVDPLLASARKENSQTWNRYAYVLNNPLRLVDPNGLQDTNAAQAALERMREQPIDTTPTPIIATPQLHEPVLTDELAEAITQANTAMGPLSGNLLNNANRAIQNALTMVAEPSRQGQTNPCRQALIAAFGGDPTSALQSLSTNGGAVQMGPDGYLVPGPQNVFDGNITAEVGDIGGQTVSISQFLADNPTVNAVTVGSNIFLDDSFNNRGELGQAQDMIHEAFVHRANGIRDSRYARPNSANPRSDGSNRINDIIREGCNRLP
jgi:RHS repeat-associated protein